MVEYVLKESVLNLVVIVPTDTKANNVMWKSTNVKALRVQMVTLHLLKYSTVNIIHEHKGFFFRLAVFQEVFALIN